MDYEYWQAKHLWKQNKYKAAYKQFLKYCRQECRIHWTNFNWKDSGYRFYRPIYVIMVIRDVSENLVHDISNYFIRLLQKFKTS